MTAVPGAPRSIDGLAYHVPAGWVLDPERPAPDRPGAAVFVPCAFGRGDSPAPRFASALALDLADVPADATVASVLDGGDAHLRRAGVVVDRVWERTAIVSAGPATARLVQLTTAAWPTPVLQLRALLDRGADARARRLVSVVLTADVPSGDQLVADAVALLDELSGCPGSRAIRR